MSDVVQETQQDFWRPPSRAGSDEIIVREALPSMAEACPRCGTEFLLGSRFCHTCGTRRPEALSAAARSDAAAMANHWEKVVAGVRSLAGFTWNKIRSIPIPDWLRSLHLHEIQRRLGLRIGSFIAFIVGLVCVAGALLVGLWNAQTLVDWQAIQFYRVEWLLAATAAFVAGILLKNPSSRDRD
jgi:hypothetical protein